MQKTILVAVVAGALGLTGCAATPDRITVTAECQVSSGDCSIKGEATWELEKSGRTRFKSGSSFDASSLAVDVSASNVNVTGTSGAVFVNAKLAGGGTASNVFNWTRSGDVIVPSNAAAINAWLANYDGQITELTTELHSIDVSQHTGTNTFAAEAYYDGLLVDGAATSWYNSGGGWNPPTDPY